jgi:hypothetical protein
MCFSQTVPAAGVEKETSTLELLCGGTKIWEKGPFNKDRHLAGGYSSTGETYYVCQIADGKHTFPATYKPSINSCCYATYGKEICKKNDFLFLANDC